MERHGQQSNSEWQNVIYRAATQTLSCMPNVLPQPFALPDAR